MCLGISVANHSHTGYFENPYRKYIIQYLDRIIVGSNFIYSYYSGLNSNLCYAYGSFNFFFCVYLYVKFLYFTATEKYTNSQKLLHFFYHIYGIISMTHYKQICYYDKN